MPQTSSTPRASLAGDVTRPAITASGPFSLVAQLRTNDAAGADRAEQVVHQLETAIAVGLIGHGERLPPERELAAQLGVAVLTLRAAVGVVAGPRLHRNPTGTRRRQRGVRRGSGHRKGAAATAEGPQHRGTT